MVNVKPLHGRPVEMTWVPVRDHEGRVHMEARWHTQPATDAARPA